MAKKQQASAALTAVVVESESPDLALVRTDGEQAAGFLAKAGQFFQSAGALEEVALTTLSAVKAMKAPSTAEEDLAVQNMLKLCSGNKKKVEDHWDEAVGPFHRVHRLLTAGRKRAVDAYESAAKIANAMHNDYVAAERRRVAIEAERLRVENERQAQLARDAEVARMEAEALKAEASSPNLSERESIFVDLVSAGRDAVSAARTAGYKDAAVQSAKLMAMAKIATALAAKTAAQAIRQQKVAVAAQPLAVEPVNVEMNVSKVAGMKSRTTHYGDVVDEQALIAAVLRGGLGIPSDILMVNRSKVNEYASSIQALVNNWPGVKYRSETKSY